MTVGMFLKGARLLGLKEDSDENLSAYHDELFIGGPDPATLTAEILKELDDLGWRCDIGTKNWQHFT